MEKSDGMRIFLSEKGLGHVSIIHSAVPIRLICPELARLVLILGRSIGRADLKSSVSVAWAALLMLFYNGWRGLQPLLRAVYAAV
jgi:hypothetical protein